MTLPYTPPGVTVEETVSTSLTPLLSAPGSLLLIGKASNPPVSTEQVTLNGTTAVPLTLAPAGSVITVNKVTNVTEQDLTALNPYLATEYTFTRPANTIARVASGSRPLSVAITQSPPATITTLTLANTGSTLPVAGQSLQLTETGSNVSEVVQVASIVTGPPIVVTVTNPILNSYTTAATVSWGIPDATTVEVTYSYVPPDYYNPIRLRSMRDIQNRFGDATTTAGKINSKLSYAAQCAWNNGASSVVLQPFYVLDTDHITRIPPSETQVGVANNWDQVLKGLEALEDIDVIVPIVGQNDSNSNSDNSQYAIFGKVQEHLYTQKHVNEEYLIALFGEDGTGGDASDSTIKQHATLLQGLHDSEIAQQLVLLNTSNFVVAGNFATTYNIGGQYVAASIGGMLVSRPQSATLTRQPIGGIISVADVRGKRGKDADAAFGLMVVESKGGVVQVRHGITLDMSTVATRELNVVHAKHYLISSIKRTLDLQIIGKIPADANATTLVNGVVIGTLESLRGSRLIDAYANVESRITSIDPTAMEVRFAYRPLFFVNYITVIFSIDLTAQSITLASSGATN